MVVEPSSARRDWRARRRTTQPPPATPVLRFVARGMFGATSERRTGMRTRRMSHIVAGCQKSSAFDFSSKLGAAASLAAGCVSTLGQSTRSPTARRLRARARSAHEGMDASVAARHAGTRSTGSCSLARGLFAATANSRPAHVRTRPRRRGCGLSNPQTPHNRDAAATRSAHQPPIAHGDAVWCSAAGSMCAVTSVQLTAGMRTWPKAPRTWFFSTPLGTLQHPAKRTANARDGIEVVASSLPDNRI